MEASAPRRLSSDVEVAYERLRRPVLRRARRWFPSLSEPDLEDVYQSAWLSVVRTRSEVADLDAYVAGAVYSQGLMELRRRRRKPTESLERPRQADWASNGVGDGDRVEFVDRTQALPDEQAETRAFAGLVDELLEELSERQGAIVKLRWGWGLSREEIAALMGISPRVVKRELARVGARLALEADAIASGGWCERKRSLITAYALELLSPTRAQKAEGHLHACPGCRALVWELRARAREIAALAPAPALAEAPGRHSLERLWEVVESGRSQLADAGTAAKQHAVATAARASDPTPLVGARPGAVAAAIAGCIAVGGSAYCAVDGIPGPVRSALELNVERGVERARGAASTPTPPPGPPPAADPEPLPVELPQAPTTTAPPAPVPPPTLPPAPPEPAQAEFFDQAPPPRTSTPRPPAARQPAQPAPASGAASEFGGP